MSKDKKSDLDKKLLSVKGIGKKTLEKIKKALNKDISKSKLKHKLNPRQERFCQLYAGDKEFFGNGVRSYAIAYDHDLSEKGKYNTCKSNAHKLLTKNYILARVNEILEESGLNDAFVDKQLKFLITQNAEFPSKVRAIREYNKLKGRLKAKKLDVTHHDDKETEEIKKELEETKRKRKAVEAEVEGEETEESS